MHDHAQIRKIQSIFVHAVHARGLPAWLAGRELDANVTVLAGYLYDSRARARAPVDSASQALSAES